MGKRGRVRLSPSPLARPDTHIHKLAGEVKKHLYLPSVDGLYVVLGTTAANMLKGVPVWLVLVGPASSGKTILLDMVNYDNLDYKLDKTIAVDVVKGPSALLSGSSRRETVKGATGGLLRAIGHEGMLLIKDFTTMMSMPREVLVETIGAFRRIYDGFWDRPVGSDGGKMLSWWGNIGLLSACTGVIDRHHSMLSELGERWIYYRYTESDGYGETIAALKNRDPKSTMQHINRLVCAFFDDMGLEWTRGGMEKREQDDEESNRIYHMARFVSAARSPVARDFRTKEVMDVKETEAPTRLAGAFWQLYLGLELLGLEEDERWRVVGKVAMDSMPSNRLRVVQTLMMRNSAKTWELRNILEMGTSSTRYVCEDLELHGILDRPGRQDRMGEGHGSWRLSQWSRKMMRLGWGK